jgi:hypothetical protein
MSTTEEEARSIEAVRRFCFDLLDPKATPRVPRAVRLRARAVCKHLPVDLGLFGDPLSGGGAMPRKPPTVKHQTHAWTLHSISEREREPLCRMCKAAGRLTEAVCIDHKTPIA